MNELPKKRPWFQIHLSTAVVLMFVAGVLIRKSIFYMRMSERDSQVWLIGWPLHAFDYFLTHDGSNIHGFYDYETINIAIDLLIALLILLFTWFISEWLIRRRSMWKA